MSRATCFFGFLSVDVLLLNVNIILSGVVLYVRIIGTVVLSICGLFIVVICNLFMYKRFNFILKLKFVFNCVFEYCLF